MTNPGSRRWISRKEIAAMADLSVDIIRANEHRLGLDQVKVEINQRTILYHREPATAIVEKLICPTPGTL